MRGVSVIAECKNVVKDVQSLTGRLHTPIMSETLNLRTDLKESWATTLDRALPYSMLTCHEELRDTVLKIVDEDLAALFLKHDRNEWQII